ncbi:MAG: PHP domain-containing protein [Ruminococcus sp.]|jgi:predicted metal-dependent phosphoesterase TrpH|nr:PHP domain-containing protein [Ruminococcus sp.]MBQ1535930.1 PHP domain-containing protein [Ruminococcus sp.]MBQ4247088.1 PHP domain-containing protein [Ruminococcus sp.]
MTGDLHCHTTLSDGSLGIEETIVQAKRMGLDFLAITDHDTLSSSSRAKILGERYGVQVIPAVELSAWDKKRNNKVHILCYAPQKPDRLEGLCMKSCQIRTECAKDMIKKVLERYPIPSDSVQKYTKGSKSIYKSHIMRALVNYGYATELYGSVNDKLFAWPNGECLVTREYPDVNFVIDLIHSSRGIAVMAHPCMFDNIELLKELIAAGKIDGIEAYHFSATTQKQQMLEKLAKDNDLIVTGGSDFHGLYNSTMTHIGKFVTDQENLDKMFKLISKNSQKTNKAPQKAEQ